MAKSNITEQAKTAGSVDTTAGIVLPLVQQGHNFMAVSAAFLEAHEALRIGIKWDRASNTGWVTAEEAKAITARMTAAL